MKTFLVLPRVGTKSMYFLSLFTMLMGCGLHFISSQTTDSIADFPKHGKIDAAVAHKNGYVYFFSGNKYIKWKPRKGVVKTKTGRVKRTIGKDGWNIVKTSFKDSLDAIFNRKGELYFLKRANYLYYIKDKLGPRHNEYRLGSGNAYWVVRYLEPHFSEDLDASFTHPDNNRIYFFKGSKYFSFKPNAFGITRSEVGYIGKDGWKSLPTFFHSDIDAALVHPTNKKIYFFKGDKYCVWQPGKGILKPAIRTRGIDGWKGVMFD